MPRRTLVIISQVFIPDPAAVGQYMASVAIAMSRRGHRVKVYTSDRGYDNPATQYPRLEFIEGAEIRRLGLTSFGKRSIPMRIAGSASFMLQVLFHLLAERKPGAIFFSTSPPLVGFVASIIGWIRRVPVAYWAMDLNPDQLIALGKLKPSHPAAWILERVNRFILKRAALVVALDRFMAQRLENRLPLSAKMLVLPPWPLEDQIHGNSADHRSWPARRDENPFRQQHGLIGRFVIMYSGNHSPSNPLETLLQAMLATRDDPTVCFAFIGGGVAKKQVEAHVRQHGLTNVLLLPYQPIETLRYSLAAADVHVASLGGEMVGIIHPCKVYGAMAAGRPILYLGPSPSHIDDLIHRHHIGWQISHGDVAGAVRTIEQIRQTPMEQLGEMGERAASIVDGHLSQRRLCGAMCDRLEQSLRLRSARNASPR
ncbi:glycosyltransferase family 4 protein [Humisphaera borealis]|uniref:Glycosyltransferase family 4 protein n=1 Tax=Humisphaera borealis TaxID=2807512 RepID=A0A7M2WZZ9_9BACT|nr:glycosyltransferase family 4 protein [Humisphaera borealis]QOV91087.1 glycosyltransferase family 4 protein [Humisphaera borealis]